MTGRIFSTSHCDQEGEPQKSGKLEKAVAVSLLLSGMRIASRSLDATIGAEMITQLIPTSSLLCVLTAQCKITPPHIAKYFSRWYHRGGLAPIFVGPATTQNRVVKFDGVICSGVLVENASDDFPQQKKLENGLPNFAGSSPPISQKISPTSLWKSLVLIFAFLLRYCALYH